MKHKLPYSNLGIVFQTKCKLITFFAFKGKILFSYVLGCLIKLDLVNALLPIMTKQSTILRMCEHLGISALTGNRVKQDNDYDIKKHHLFSNHSSGFGDFSILASNSNDFKDTSMESFFSWLKNIILSYDSHILVWL